MPELASLHDAMYDRGVTVLGISMDTEGPEVVNTSSKRLRITYPVLLGNDSVADAYDEVYALPSTFIIDQQGMIVQHIIGLLDIPPASRHLTSCNILSCNYPRGYMQVISFFAFFSGSDSDASTRPRWARMAFLISSRESSVSANHSLTLSRPWTNPLRAVTVP